MGIAFVLLRRTQVRVLSGVARRSLGEVCSVAGVLIVFMLAKGDPLAYCVPVLVLTIADAGAGVLGSAFGRLQGFFGKTIEGSGVFFIAAFLVTLIPLMVTGAAQPAGAIAVSFLLAVTVTPVEAFSPYGLDNLLVPVASLVVFRGLM
jgi:phytol kinase